MVMQNLFPAIWDKDSSCEVILFGNHYCSKEDEHGPTEKDCANIDKAIEQAFLVYCQNADSYEWLNLGDTYKLKKQLLPRPAIHLIPLKKQAEDEAYEIEQLAKSWMDSAKLEELSNAIKNPHDRPIQDLLTEQKMGVDELLKAMNLQENSVVALDICLLYGDHKRIRDGMPGICMALYAALLEKQHSVFLYSSLALSKWAKESWARTYQALWGDTDEILIHSWYGLVTAEQDTEEKKALLKLL